MTLMDVLARVRRLIALPGNDFGWSRWGDVDEALREFDALVAAVRSGERPLAMRILFAPTGALQELSISSGWSVEFLELAAEFDKLSQSTK